MSLNIVLSRDVPSPRQNRESRSRPSRSRFNLGLGRLGLGQSRSRSTRSRASLGPKNDDIQCSICSTLVLLPPLGVIFLLETFSQDDYDRN